MRSTRPATAERLLLPVRPRYQCSHFHSSPVRAKRKPPHRSLSKAEVDHITTARSKFYAGYTKAEKAALAKHYTADQLAAIEAGEQAISEADLATQARVRDDFFIPHYLDDYSRLQPVIDKKLSKMKGEGSDYHQKLAYNPNALRGGNEDGLSSQLKKLDMTQLIAEDRMLEIAREHGVPRDQLPSFKTPEEAFNFAMIGRRDAPEKVEPLPDLSAEWEAYNQKLAQMKPGDQPPSPPEYNLDDLPSKHQIDHGIPIPPKTEKLSRYELASRNQPHFYNEAMEKALNKALGVKSAVAEEFDAPDVAPQLPTIRDPRVRWSTQQEDASMDDETALAFARLAKSTGQTIDQLRKYRVKLLVSRRVVNQTRLGKVASQYFLAVAGDENGMVGLGEGKAAEMDEAARQARLNAIRNLAPIRRYENRTIYGEVTGKCGAVELTLSPRPPGFGLRVSSHLYEIARCAGLSDLSGKVHRSRNPMNVCKAIWKALQSQKDPEDIARARGKKMVDVRKVYYSGLV